MAHVGLWALAVFGYITFGYLFWGLLAWKTWHNGNPGTPLAWIFFPITSVCNSGSEFGKAGKNGPFISVYKKEGRRFYCCFMAFIWPLAFWRFLSLAVVTAGALIYTAIILLTYPAELIARLFDKPKKVRVDADEGKTKQSPASEASRERLARLKAEHAALTKEVGEKTERTQSLMDEIVALEAQFEIESGPVHRTARR